MRLYSAKETYSFKEPTNRSHPISTLKHEDNENETRRSFAKEPYKWDYILQKRPIVLRSLLMKTKQGENETIETPEHKHTMSIEL